MTTVSAVFRRSILPAKPSQCSTRRREWRTIRHEPAKAIRGALSRALVPYHPVAGRIVASDKGEAEVACTASGVWFVEASADCTLEDVNRLQRPLSIPAAELLPQAPTKADSEGLILLVQVCYLVLLEFT